MADPSPTSSGASASNQIQSINQSITGTKGLVRTA